MLMFGSFLTSLGRQFHAAGPALAKDLLLNRVYLYCAHIADC